MDVPPQVSCRQLGSFIHLYFHLVQPPIPRIRYLRDKGIKGFSWIHTASCLDLRVPFIFFFPIILRTGDSVFWILPLPQIVTFLKDSACECQLRNCPEVPRFLVVAFLLSLSRDSTLVIPVEVRPSFLVLALLLLPELSFVPSSKWAREAVGVLRCVSK